MIKKITTLLVLIAAALVFPRIALGFGITPAEINVSDIKPGSHFETQIYVTRPPDQVNEDLKVVLETDLGEMEDWIEFSPGREFEFPSGENVTTFGVTIDVPSDVKLTNYKGQVTAKGLSDNRASEGVTIIKGAVLGIALAATDEDNADLKVLSINAPDVNSGDPVRLNLNIENPGNIAAAPDRVDLEVMDVFENPIESLSDSTLEQIEPFSTKEIQAEFNSQLEKGQYRVDASVIFQGDQIASKRMLLTVNAKPAQVDEEAPQPERAMVWEAQTGMWLTILGVLLLAVVLMLVVRKEKDTDPNFEKRLARYLHKNKLVAWILLGISLAMIFAGFYTAMDRSAGVGSPKTKQKTEMMMKEDGVPDTMNEETDQSTGSSEVRGVSVEITDTPEVNADGDAAGEDASFRIERPGTPGLFPIFAEPSFGAEIIYEAEPGETFHANFLEDGWYRVELEDGSQGWLHETSISKR